MITGGLAVVVIYGCRRNDTNKQGLKPGVPFITAHTSFISRCWWLWQGSLVSLQLPGSPEVRHLQP